MRAKTLIDWKALGVWFISLERGVHGDVVIEEEQVWFSGLLLAVYSLLFDFMWTSDWFYGRRRMNTIFNNVLNVFSAYRVMGDTPTPFLGQILSW